ncbi:hypothetical protein BGZ61DRAFT_469978 [Ilyonectria robusta]|uniref:uncharacterized protein n=1 Tax=Ilyonectria robusta TaxID=1079257 RepID=UPI001E8EB154|nr:uncharacterized protein BGZ61DRAFT_469978 [Ilyonectria robusta]KAH8646528.1 hypothetical protein BGZ61DRAFT_469978 [Ilyonectria robusta]
MADCQQAQETHRQHQLAREQGERHAPERDRVDVLGARPHRIGNDADARARSATR